MFYFAKQNWCEVLLWCNVIVVDQYWSRQHFDFEIVTGVSKCCTTGIKKLMGITSVTKMEENIKEQ